jgi:hypothetical protein
MLARPTVRAQQATALAHAMKTPVRRHPARPHTSPTKPAAKNNVTDTLKPVSKSMTPSTVTNARVPI